MMIHPVTIANFQKKILSYYDEHSRSMPWREDLSPYSIFISEIMLQQTQVSRVKKHFSSFRERFPNFVLLAQADLPELLLLWKGLGYNRRVRFMQQSARLIVDQYGEKLPADPAELVRLPGIGPNTAGSIVAFAFNLPVVFIETNIRRVFIHEFFKNDECVHDRQLLPIIEASIPPDLARVWYWALMDYGTSLKEEGRVAARKSIHHTRQSEFLGSPRQLRAAILHELAQLSVQGKEFVEEDCLSRHLHQRLPTHPFDHAMLSRTLEELRREGFIAAEIPSSYRLER